MGIAEGFRREFLDQRLGAYQLLMPLASGGMGSLFLARVSEGMGSGRLVVVKRLLPWATDGASLKKLFESETRILLGLNHPNIVTLLDFGESDDTPYLVLEWIEGRSLKEVIWKDEAAEPLSPGLALWIASEVALGLEYAHGYFDIGAGKVTPVVHRDVSPSNIMLTLAGNVKLVDFGIAKTLTEAVTQGVRPVLGKTQYLSPESCRGERADCRTDIFSLGIVLWEMLTGTNLFEGESVGAIVWKINDPKFEILRPSSLVNGIPEALDEVVLRALEREPEDRFASAHEFGAALRKCLGAFTPKVDRSEVARCVSSRFGAIIAEDRARIRALVSEDPGPAPRRSEGPEAPGVMELPELAIPEAPEAPPSEEPSTAADLGVCELASDPSPTPEIERVPILLANNTLETEPPQPSGKRRYRLRLVLALILLLGGLGLYLGPSLIAKALPGPMPLRAYLSNYCGIPYHRDQGSVLGDLYRCLFGR
jgi:eukaryotic-like serine/threonine-protein kinase